MTGRRGKIRRWPGSAKMVDVRSCARRRNPQFSGRYTFPNKPVTPLKYDSAFSVSFSNEVEKRCGKQAGLHQAISRGFHL